MNRLGPARQGRHTGGKVRRHQAVERAPPIDRAPSHPSLGVFVVADPTLADLRDPFGRGSVSMVGAMSSAWDHDEAGAFIETLFAKHHGEIYAYLLRMLREPELAADLTQDAFVKAYKNYETLEKPENARAWLYQIAHRVALDEIRRRKIVRFFPWTGESRGSAPSAERLVMDAHLSGDMQRALARIPERQRAALLLAELHDLTGLELAAGPRRVARGRACPADTGARKPSPGAGRRAYGRGRGRSQRRRAEPIDRRPPVSRIHRLRRRAGHAASVHERARSLAAIQLTEALKPVDNSWLLEHLSGCDACRQVLAGYEADRASLRRLRDQQPQPPRDLWARTAAAVEREAVASGRAPRRATANNPSSSLGPPSAGPAGHGRGCRGRRRGGRGEPAVRWLPEPAAASGRHPV
jgi:RNA polymerase sigma-70 factor (ECF subfamily)